MYEKFTDRARKAMQLANQEAQRFNHEYIGTEHILLGVIAEGTGVAAIVLRELDIDLRKVRREVEKIVMGGPDMLTMGILPQTPRAKKVIEFAIEEARNFKHNYVGTEHLLLGLLREDEGVAAQVLMNMGLSLKDVRRQVLKILETSSEAIRSNSPASDEPMVVAPGSTAKYKLEFQNLPICARAIIHQFNFQIEVLNEEKEEAVANQDFEKAAHLRDLADKLQSFRDEFLCRWPTSPS